MAWFWNSKSPSEDTPVAKSNEDSDLNLPKDLATFLDHKESDLSDREFKKLLTRQHNEATDNRINELPETTTDTIKQVIQEEMDFQHQKKLQQDASGDNDDDDFKKMKIEPPQFERFERPITVEDLLKSKYPTKYSAVETEIYKGSNPTREAVITNCSEHQLEFLKCLKKQSLVSKLSGFNTECDQYSNLFYNCAKIQKMAFALFDYPSLTTIEELQGAQMRIDKAFTRYFKNMEDINNDDKYFNYTKDLKESREEFYRKFGK